MSLAPSPSHTDDWVWQEQWLLVRCGSDPPTIFTPARQTPAESVFDMIPASAPRFYFAPRNLCTFHLCAVVSRYLSLYWSNSRGAGTKMEPTQWSGDEVDVSVSPGATQGCLWLCRSNFPLFDLFFLNVFIRKLFLINDRDVLVQTGVGGSRKSYI